MPRRTIARTTTSTTLRTLAGTTRVVALAAVSALTAFLAGGCGAVPHDGSETVPITCGGGGDAQLCRASTTVCGFAGRAFATAYGAGLYSDLGSGARNLTAPVGANPTGAYHVSTGDDFCVPSASDDPLSLAQKTLIQSFGCSSPYFFEAFNSNLTTPATGPANGSSCVVGVDPWTCWSDKANGYPQLCPASRALTAYVKSLGLLKDASGQRSDLPAHFAGDRASVDQVSGDLVMSFDTARLVPSPQLGATPSAPAGYAWVIPWEDPHACTGGCMCAI